jgi:ketosteroid isomerase-like protein
VGIREVMDVYIDAVRAGDRDRAFALFADDVVGHVPGRSVLAGELRGRDAVVGYITSVVEKAHGDVDVELVDMLVGTEYVALVVREHIRAPEQVLDIRRANVYRVQGDRITEVWIFEHHQYEVDAWISALWGTG